MIELIHINICGLLSIHMPFLRGWVKEMSHPRGRRELQRRMGGAGRARADRRGPSRRLPAAAAGRRHGHRQAGHADPRRHAAGRADPAAARGGEGADAQGQGRQACAENLRHGDQGRQGRAQGAARQEDGGQEDDHGQEGEVLGPSEGQEGRPVHGRGQRAHARRRDQALQQGQGPLIPWRPLGRRPGHHLRHHAARRRAVARHLAEHRARSSRSRTSSRASASTSSRPASRSPRRATSRPCRPSPARSSGPVIAGLARVHAATSSAPADAVRDAERPRIHTFISTSDIHIEHQLAVDARGRLGAGARRRRARRARSSTTSSSPRWTPPAPTSSSPPRCCRSPIDEGATTINIPDTVGYAMPDEYAALPRPRSTSWSPACATSSSASHCHDDLGLAVANSFAGVQAGARQVEVAINGIGERAGNASLEEIVMLLETRKADVGLRAPASSPTEIARTSRLVSRLTGYACSPTRRSSAATPSPTSPASTRTASSRSARPTRSWTRPRSASTRTRSSSASTPAATRSRPRSRSSATTVDGAALNQAFKRFKEVADRKKQVTAMDLEALVTDELREAPRRLDARVVRGRGLHRRPPHARVALRDADGRDGPRRLHRRRPDRRDLPRHQRRHRATRACATSASTSVTGGQDALGEASVVLELAGQTGVRARASPPTSSRRPRSPTSARSPTPSVGSTRPRLSGSRDLRADALTRRLEPDARSVSYGSGRDR